MLYILGILVGLLVVALAALAPFFLLLVVGEFTLTRLSLGRVGKYLLLIIKSLRRNLLRTGLTYLATFVLVFIVTLVWSVLYFLDVLAVEKTKDLKMLVTEKWQFTGQVPFSGQMPFSYAAGLSEGAADPTRPEDIRPDAAMTWQFYLGSLEQGKQTRDSLVAVVALEPYHLVGFLEELFDELSQHQNRNREMSRAQQTEILRGYIRLLERNKRALLIGRTRLEAIHKRVGERFTLISMNYPGLDLEFEIVGILPDGRYNEIAFCHRDYLNDALAAYPRTHAGQKHPRADRTLDMVWLKVPNQEAFGRVAEQIESSSWYRDPAVKCQTLSAHVATVLEAYRGLVWGIRWLLAPTILATMALILANAIGISVRERHVELAVLKVMGFRPRQILMLVLGEALLLGAASGGFSVALTYWAINDLFSSYNPSLMSVPDQAFWWGPAVGALTALAGSLVPAWTACTVRVSEVFAKTT